jgi:hypothetical protein
MRKLHFEKLYTVNKNGYNYPVLEATVETTSDGSIEHGYLHIHRERGLQMSKTFEGEWTVESYYFPNDPVENHLETKLIFSQYLIEKIMEAVKHLEDNRHFEFTEKDFEENKDIVLDFIDANWVAMASNHKHYKSVSREDHRWYMQLPSLEVKKEEDDSSVLYKYYKAQLDKI